MLFFSFFSDLFFVLFFFLSQISVSFPIICGFSHRFFLRFLLFAVFFPFVLFLSPKFVYFPPALSSLPSCALSALIWVFSSPFYPSGIVVAHYLQSITTALALGGELVYHRRPGEEGAVLSLAGRYTGTAPWAGLRGEGWELSGWDVWWPRPYAGPSKLGGISLVGRCGGPAPRRD